MWERKCESPILAIKKLMEEKHLNHKDAKFITAHINIEYRQCNRCNFKQLQYEYENCLNCEALNSNWIIH